jgi:hypothetical protein
MNSRAKYFDKRGTEISADDALDRHGALRNGFAMRVPTTMRDSMRARDLLAVIAASHRYEKYQTEELIEQIIEQATLALDQIFGLRAMPLHRPDFDQMSELIRAANAARANAGLDPLPVLKQ